MKKTSKILALVLVVAMVVAMGVGTVAFAAAAITPATDRTTETDGAVKVTNAADGQTYTLYKLFNADMGANDAITYTLPSGKTAADLTYNGKSWFELNSNGFVVAKEGTNTDWAKDPDAIAWAKSFGTPNATTKTGADAKTGWTGLDYGYYFVDTTLGAFIGVDSANKTAEITEKNEEPKIDKSITGVKDPDETAASTATLGTGDETTDPGEGANEKAIAEVGDTVSYQLVVKAKAGAENYKVTDVLTNLALVASSLKIEGTAYASSTIVDKTASSVTDGASTFTLVFTKAFLDEITEDTDITITYDAIVQPGAVIGQDGNDNTATLTYGHKDTPDSSEDSAKVYVAQISVTKNDGEKNGLAGAVFALKNSEGKYYKKDASTGDVTWVTALTDATTYTSGENGSLDGIFTGLSNGNYTLEEVTAPEGYNEIDPADDSLKFTIADKDYTDSNLKQATTVINNAGTELPETGGIGTTIFYVVGAILVVGAVVILVTRRRMRAR